MDTDRTQIACHECDLLIEISDFLEGHKASCPRCHYVLTVKYHNTLNRVLSFSLTAVFFFALSFLFPFITFSAQGQQRTVTLMQSISVLVTENFTSLAIVVLLFTIAIPILYLANVIYVYISLNRSRLFPYTRLSLKGIFLLKHWNMAEIFLISVLVSFIKIIALADISLGPSFVTYVFFILSMTTAVLHIDNHSAWKWLKEKEGKFVNKKPVQRGINYQGCHVCTDVLDLNKQHCDNCGSRCHNRIKNSIQKTAALLLTSICLYFPANFLPIMRTNFLGDESANTIMGGVIILWHHGSYPIALVIFIASIVVPLGKIIALSCLCYSVHRKSRVAYHQKTILYRITEIVGRWSMVDVFVVVVLVALIQMGNLMTIVPDWGAVAFAVMVILTILAAISFDPRLIWDPLNEQDHNE